MPELPEVEIVRRSLDKNIKQKKVKKVIVRNNNLRIRVPNILANTLENKKITEVSRFSKYLILKISNKQYCIIHLGMSGTIHLVKKKNSQFTNLSFYNSPFLPKKHNHIEIIFDKFKIIYNDPRRFGFFQILKNDRELNDRFKKFGPEPFDKKFNINYIKNFFRKKNKNIKNFLLDQKFVSGVGNIYASEILFLSKINPFKKAGSLSTIDCKKIILNSKKVLIKAIVSGGSSIQNFKNTYGKEGDFQKEFNVYLRDGENCKRKSCKGKILKKIITNRSTFFCKYCQK
jgi:formamidopyrimidine-DNA glycosylase